MTRKPSKALERVAARKPAKYVVPAGIVDRPPINTRTDAVLRKISEAVAWGIPDAESLGYTHRAFVDLLGEARDEILRLQRLTTK